MRSKNSKGFSLIELILVVTIMSIIMTMTTGILLSLLKSGQKSKGLGVIRQNGDAVISKIEEAVRSTRSISVNSSVISYKDSSGDTYEMGFVPAGICANVNGYIYLRRSLTGPAFDKCNQNVRFTNSDPTDGVNVTSFDAVLDTTNDPPRVSILLKIDKSTASASTENLETEFRTFITTRTIL